MSSVPVYESVAQPLDFSLQSSLMPNGSGYIAVAKIRSKPMPNGDQITGISFVARY
jgi:hypothetical protein